MTFVPACVTINDMCGSMRNSLLRDERLRAVFDLLGGAKLVLDVGCDHGYLSAALVEEGRAERVIASDISPASVEKAYALARDRGIIDRMHTVCADGLTPLAGTETPYRIAISGMGGELIARILERERSVAEKAELIVMQPMRGEAELREYLYRGGFAVADEKVVLDEGRFYQVIAARFGEKDIIPEGFPKNWFRFGWVMASKPEEMMLPLLLHYRAAYEKELEKAMKKGRTPAEITDEIKRTDALMGFVKGRNQCS